MKKKRQRKPLSDTVHPQILERARIANGTASIPGYSGTWYFGDRESGHIESVVINTEISLDTSVLLVEAASIILEVESNNGSKL